MSAHPGEGYGHFSEDGTEYRITDPRTPRPWANIIANPRMGLAVSQSGSGFTGEDALVAKFEPRHAPRMGETIEVAVELEAMHLFDRATERRLES